MFTRTHQWEDINSPGYQCLGWTGLFLAWKMMQPKVYGHPCQCLSIITRRNGFPFSYKFNGIWSWWQFSSHFLNQIEFHSRKTVTTIIFQQIWKEIKIYFYGCTHGDIYFGLLSDWTKFQCFKNVGLISSHIACSLDPFQWWNCVCNQISVILIEWELTQKITFLCV